MKPIQLFEKLIESVRKDYVNISEETLWKNRLIMECNKRTLLMTTRKLINEMGIKFKTNDMVEVVWNHLLGEWYE